MERPDSINTVTAAQLAGAGRDLPVPFGIGLLSGADKENLVCHEVFRLLPGKRVVARAEWNGREVLAKLFVDSSAAARHRSREESGVRALLDAGIRTPEILGAGALADGGEFILFEYLQNADSLAAQWDAASTDPDHMAVLRQALSTIGAMHRAGLVQHDIHLDNFLLCRDALYCIDGADVDAGNAGRPLPAQQSLANLGLFFAQLYPCFERMVPQGYEYYLQARGQGLDGVDVPQVLAEVHRQRGFRQKHFMGKIFRDCTAFAVRRSWRRFTVCDRRDDTAELREVLDNPDRYLFGEGLLKEGNTATVGLVEVDGRSLVLKRYNIKGTWHGLQRAFQVTRGWKSWRNGHMLLFLGIPTPRPVALVEERYGPLRSRAFLLTEAVSGPHALQYFSGDLDTLPDAGPFARQLADILEGLYAASISHGDLKATNLLVPDSGPTLIDLDAMRQHRSRGSFRKAFNKDLDRFMKNWEKVPDAKALFDPLVERLRARLAD